jgi:hypothetical protein
MSAEQRLLEQLRTRTPRAASAPEDVVCCGHDLDAHDDDGCNVGWEQAEVVAAYKSGRHDGCPCRVRGWAR